MQRITRLITVPLPFVPDNWHSNVYGQNFLETLMSVITLKCND